jgi:hypothetical protein
MNQASRKHAKANLFSKDILCQRVTIRVVNGTGLAV